MAKTKIGKVGITPRGTYSNTKNYVRLDVVTENGSSYVCLKDCIGKAVTDTEYWQLVAEKGDKGDKPVNGVDYNTDAEKTEFKNEVVTETKTDIADYVTEQKTELNTYTETKKGELDEHESAKETELNTKATELTNAFNTNATSKTKDYNDNATAKTTDFDNNATEKTTAYNDNATTKLEEYNTNATTKTNEFNENVDSLNNKITKLENENDDLYNALYTEKTNGTEIYIEDAKKCRLVNTEICGKYMQETTTGKNLVDFSTYMRKPNEIDYTFENDILTATQNSQYNYASVDFDMLSIIKNNPSKGLKFTFESIDISNFTSASKVIAQIVIRENNELKYYVLYNSENAKYTYTIPSDVTNITSALFRVYTNNSNDDTVSTSSITISKPMLMFTDVTDETYEKYTGSIASPNPNYPQKIEQIENVQLNIYNKNLLKSYVNGVSTPYLGALYIDFDCDTTKKYVLSFVDNSIGNCYYRNEYFVKSYKVYNFISTGKRQTYYFSAKTMNKDSNAYVVGKGWLLLKSDKEQTLTPNFTDVMLEEVDDFNSQPSEYEPNKNQIINIDLKGNKLCAVSDVIKDKLLIDKKGNVALQKNVEYVKFTSQEGWNTNGEAVSRYGYVTPVLNILANSNENMYISNIAVISNTANAKYNAVLSGTTASSKLRVYIPKTFFNSELTQLKALNELLQKTPMELYYKLATPEIIDLGQLSELPETFEGTNNIWVETNLGNTEIEIEYVQDVKKLIEQTQAMIIANASEEVTQ